MPDWIDEWKNKKSAARLREIAAAWSRLQAESAVKLRRDIRYLRQLQRHNHLLGGSDA